MSGGPMRRAEPAAGDLLVVDLLDHGEAVVLPYDALDLGMW